MILVDTAVWIDHFHATEPRLIDALEADDVACHAMVLQELALGSIKNRDVTLGLLSALRFLPTLSHQELLRLVAEHRLWGRGLSPVDAHLLGSLLLTPGSQLWTRDKRLREAADMMGVRLLQE